MGIMSFEDCFWCKTSKWVLKFSKVHFLSLFHEILTFPLIEIAFSSLHLHAHWISYPKLWLLTRKFSGYWEKVEWSNKICNKKRNLKLSKNRRKKIQHNFWSKFTNSSHSVGGQQDCPVMWCCPLSVFWSINCLEFKLPNTQCQ